MFGLDGEVGGLLGLQNQTAGADGVDDACGNEEDVARLHGDPVDEFCHTVHVLHGLVHGGFEFLTADFPGESVVNAGVGPGGQDDPGLGLAVGAAEEFPGIFSGGVDLHGQADGAVQILDQHADIFTVSQTVCPVLLEKLGKGQIGALHHGDALQRAGGIGVDGMDGGSDPLLRMEAILRGVPQEVTEEPAAQIDAEHPVTLKKDRSLPKLFRHGQILPVCYTFYPL